MDTEWVDFKKVKDAVDMQMVLDHYGINGLRKSGNELRGPCPIHKGSRQIKNFTVNVRKNAFQCFSKDCGARGNILDLVAAMERCSVRAAALKLQEWFRVGESQLQSVGEHKDNDTAVRVQRGIYRDNKGSLYELIAKATSAEDFTSVVVYRELFGDYCLWIAPLESFFPTDKGSEDRSFILVKEI